MQGLRSTYGALLVGAFIACFLSGVTTVQTVIFYKLYKKDYSFYKTLVFFVWVLDICHSCFLVTAMWDYFILNFANSHYVNVIPLSIALTVIITAVLTLFAQCFCVYRIHLLSKKNWFLTIPIGTLVLSRLVTASVTGAEMVHLRDYNVFREHFLPLFSVVLALSAFVDITITVCLFVLLRSTRKQSLSMDDVIDTLILYNFEIQSLTSTAATITLIFWLVGKTNLVFLGVHFIIGKLYANSLLVTLNTRREIGRTRFRGRPSFMNLDRTRRPGAIQIFSPHAAETEYGSSPVNVHISVDVEKTIDMSS